MAGLQLCSSCGNCSALGHAVTCRGVGSYQTVLNSGKLEPLADGMSPATVEEKLRGDDMKPSFIQRMDTMQNNTGEPTDDCGGDEDIKVHHLRIDGSDPLALFVELLRKL